jgi:hypothetical protein
MGYRMRCNPRLRDASHYLAQVHPQYKFEGMTDMINGAFMEDLSELLNSATGDQRRRKTSYEIDTEFEKPLRIVSVDNVYIHHYKERAK